MDLGSRLIEELGVAELFQIGPITVTESIFNTWILLVLVLIFCLWLTHGLKVKNPGKRQLAAESFVLWIEKTIKSMLGEKASKYVYFVITLLVFIAVSNLSAILETRVTSNYTIFKPPTKDLSVTIAMAVISICAVEIAGIRARGVGGWLKSFSKPMAIITPINILEIVIRPLSLCMRLFGNIFGGFIIMEILKLLVPFAVPVPFSFYFEIFDGLIQAYVFVFLTSIYISEAVE